ncbi:MAG: NAD(+)/NADH kinase [Lautropia sp.]|nr:NAD(+)/NADH kinase [Lautropia sp.]
MSAHVKTVALFGRPQADDLTAPILGDIERWLRQRGIMVLTPTNRNNIRSIQSVGRRADLAIVVGGDGTMLGIARTLAPLGVPLVGVNRGRLGFITDIPISRWPSSLEAILDGHFEIEDRALIEVSAYRGDQLFFHSRALNDVVISRSSRTGLIEIEVCVDDLFMYSPRADGLIVATPTGSTAYALSVNGPIMHPSLQGFVLAPVAPQALSNRPIILPDHCEVELTIRHGKRSRLNCDMQSFADLQVGDRIILRRSADSSRFLHPPGYSYYATLRTKLNWHEIPGFETSRKT